MNSCYFCGGKLKKENIKIARYWGNQLVALKDVPTLVCTQCGEKYFDAKVSAKIDERIQDAINRKIAIQKISVPQVQF